MLSGSSARLIVLHQVDRLAVLGDERVELVHADAVLAGAGAAHRDRAQADALGERLRPARARPRSFGIEQHAAGGSCRRRRGRRSARSSPVASASACVSSTQSASREIGTQASVANACLPGRQRHRGVVRVVPRLPQPRAVLGLASPTRTRCRRDSSAIACIMLRLLRARRPRCRGTRRTASASPRSPRASSSGCTRPSARRRGARCARPGCRAASR